MTTAKAALHFDVSERTIRRWIQAGKLKASWSNGQWAVRTDEQPSECPTDRESVGTDDRLTETLQSEINNLKTKLEQADFEIAHLTQRVEEKIDQIKHLADQLSLKDKQIDSHAQQIDHLTQIVAMSQKNIGALTEQLDDSRQMIEDMRSRSWWKRIFRR